MPLVGFLSLPKTPRHWGEPETVFKPQNPPGPLIPPGLQGSSYLLPVCQVPLICCHSRQRELHHDFFASLTTPLFTTDLTYSDLSPLPCCPRPHLDLDFGVLALSAR